MANADAGRLLGGESEAAAAQDKPGLGQYVHAWWSRLLGWRCDDPVNLGLRYKIMILTAVPTLLALAAVVLTVRHQVESLAQQERALVESALLAAKETELRGYVKLAQSSIRRYVESNAPGAREEAMKVLQRLEFGTDGYFFVYDMHGVNLMHPREPALVGRNLWELRDQFGTPTIQRLIAAAQQGGGIVRYYWNKPSLQSVAPKLGYVEAVTPWGWMMGTGLYLDDIERNLREIDTRTQSNIEQTLLLLLAIAAGCVVVISGSGLVLNLSDHREATAKLRQLAQQVVTSGEEERARLARELHDGVSQVLVSSKLLVETARDLVQHDTATKSQGKITQTLSRGLERLTDAMHEIRRVSHNLRPPLLDDLGLVAALELLVQQSNENSGMRTKFEVTGIPACLPAPQATALFRIAQEALTNARVHSGGSEAEVALRFSGDRVALQIRDNGGGFDVERRQVDRRRGIGLRNMRERMAGLGGECSIRSGCLGTVVQASLRVTQA